MHPTLVVSEIQADNSTASHLWKESNFIVSKFWK